MLKLVFVAFGLVRGAISMDMVLYVVGGNCIILNAWSGSINGHEPGTT